MTGWTFDLYWNPRSSGPAAKSKLLDGVVLDGNADEVGDWILEFLDQLGGLLFVRLAVLAGVGRGAALRADLETVEVLGQPGGFVVLFVGENESQGVEQTRNRLREKRQCKTRENDREESQFVWHGVLRACTVKFRIHSSEDSRDGAKRT